MQIYLVFACATHLLFTASWKLITPYYLVSDKDGQFRNGLEGRASHIPATQVLLNFQDLLNPEPEGINLQLFFRSALFFGCSPAHNVLLPKEIIS